MNDLKIQNGKPVDENIRPIMVDGKTTSIEISQSGDGCKVTGTLEVTDSVNVNTVKTNKVESSGNLELNVEDNHTIEMHEDGTKFADFQGAIPSSESSSLTLYENGGASVVDLFRIKCFENGASQIQTWDNTGTDAYLKLLVDGYIELYSTTGQFKLNNNGTEFSATNSAYAGMILGYTALDVDATTDSYAVTNAFVTVSSSHMVTFKSHPSGNVEIFVNIFDDAAGARPLYFGLSDNATYNAVDVTHEHHVLSVDETDEKEINHRWVISGLTPNTSYTYYLGAKSTHNSFHVLKWGGDATTEYGPFIMKAIALPETVYGL